MVGDALMAADYEAWLMACMTDDEHGFHDGLAVFVLCTYHSDNDGQDSMGMVMCIPRVRSRSR